MSYLNKNNSEERFLTILKPVDLSTKLAQAGFQFRKKFAVH